MSKGGLKQLRMQVIWDRFLAVVEEQAQTLIRTAFSTSTREAGDLSAGLFDEQGRMVVQAVTGTPGHVNAMAASVAFSAAYPLQSMAEGDVYITNDPWMGLAICMTSRSSLRCIGTAKPSDSSRVPRTSSMSVV